MLVELWNLSLLRERWATSLRYASTLITFSKAFVLCRRLTVLALRRGRPMTGWPVGQDNVMYWWYNCTTFFDHLSLSPFLQVGPACRNANFYPDLELSPCYSWTWQRATLKRQVVTYNLAQSLQVRSWTCVTLTIIIILQQFFFPVKPCMFLWSKPRWKRVWPTCFWRILNVHGLWGEKALAVEFPLSSDQSEGLPASVIMHF